jgi:hypothetical protein
MASVERSSDGPSPTIEAPFVPLAAPAPAHIAPQGVLNARLAALQPMFGDVAAKLSVQFEAAGTQAE